MTKTVKQITEEYINRQKNAKYNIKIKIEYENTIYYGVTNIYRDGIKIETPDLDEEFHKYEFDTVVKVGIFDSRWPFAKTHWCLRGMIEGFSMNITD